MAATPRPAPTSATPAPNGRAGHGSLAWFAVLLLCLSAALAALLEALLVPFYAGNTLVPVAAVAALVSNIALPVLARTVVPTMLGVALPFVAWLIVIIGFGVFGRPEGDVILPGGNPQWVAYGVLLGGALAGTVTVVTIAPKLPPPGSSGSSGSSGTSGAPGRSRVSG